MKIVYSVLNEDEFLDNENVKPITADNDFMLRFIPEGSIGVHTGKKHFSSIEEAEAFIRAIDISGFSVSDLWRGNNPLVDGIYIMAS